MDRERLTRMLNKSGGHRKKSRIEDPKLKASEVADPPADSAPLPLDHATFWRGRPVPDDLWTQVPTGTTTAAVPRRLGAFPFWRGQTPLLEILDDIYPRAADAGLKTYVDLSTPTSGER